MNEHSESKDDKTAPGHAPIMSALELAHLGDGEVAYIKILPSEEAREMFPAVQDLPLAQDNRLQNSVNLNVFSEFEQRLFAHVAKESR